MIEEAKNEKKTLFNSCCIVYTPGSYFFRLRRHEKHKRRSNAKSNSHSVCGDSYCRAAAEPTLATTVRYVICDVLNVRAEPVFSGTDNIIGSCVYGELIDVVETGEDYYKILWFEDGYDYAYVNSGVAYTSEEDPDKMESAPLSTADPNGPTTTMWILSVTRLRSEPKFVGTENIICELPAGETIEVLEEASNYYVVKWPEAEGQLAYITNDPTLVSRTDPNLATPAPEAPAT